MSNRMFRQPNSEQITRYIPVVTCPMMRENDRKSHQGCSDHKLLGRVRVLRRTFNQ